ncbi:MAG: hypothetical protein RLN75_02180 [Longimicrobiales bacterium]
MLDRHTEVQGTDRPGAAHDPGDLLEHERDPGVVACLCIALNSASSYGDVCCAGNAVRGGALDQQEMEELDDILVYTTEPFAEGVK